MKPKILLAVVVALLGCVALAVLLVLAGAGFFNEPAVVVVTQERFNQIQPGMALAEVEAIFGGPPGHYAADECTLNVHYAMIFLDLYDPRAFHSWSTDTGFSAVWLDGHGRVTRFVFHTKTRPWFRRLWDALPY